MSTKQLGTLGVKLTALSSDFVKSLSKARVKMKAFADASERAAKASAVAFASVTGSIGLATRAAGKQEAAEKKLTAAFRATGKSLDLEGFKKYAGELQKVTTFGDEVTIETAAMLGSFRMEENQIKALIPVLQDYAALHGKDLKTSAATFGRALDGSASTLRRYGVALTDSQEKAWSAGSKNERLAILVKGLEGSVGGMAKELAKTGTGAFEQFGNAIGDTVEQIGFFIDKPVGRFFGKLTNAVSALNDKFAGLSPELKGVITSIAVIGIAGLGAITALTAMGALLPMLASGVAALASVFMTVVVPIAAIVAGIAGVILYIGAMRQAWDGLTQAWDENAFYIRGGIEGIGRGISAVGEWIIDVWGSVTKTVRELWDTAFDWIAKKFDSFVKGFRGVMDWLQAAGIMAASIVLGETPEMAQKTAQAARAGGGLLGGGAHSGVTDAASEAASAVLAAVKKDFAKFAFNFGEVVSNLGTTAKEVFTRAGGDLKKAFGEGVDAIPGIDIIKDVAKNMIDDVSGLFDDILTDGIDDIGDTLDDVGDTLSKASDGLAKTKDKVVVAADESATSLTAGETAAGAGQSLMSGTGSAGDVAGGAIEGGKSGGIWGAVAGAAVALLKKTEFFGQFVNMLSAAVNTMVVSLDQTMKPLVPLVEMLKKIFVIFGKFVTSVGSLEPGLMVMAKIMQGVAWAVEKVVGVMIDAWNGLIDRVASAFGKLPWDIGDKIAKKLKASKLGSLDETLREYELDFGERTILRDNLGARLGDAADAASEFGAALTNVPAGFKTALARFNAIDPGDAGIGLGLGAAVPAMAGGTGGRTVVNNVTINGVNDPEELYREIRKLEEQEAFMTTGTTIRSGGEQSVHQPK